MSKEERLLNSIAYTTWDAINNAFEHKITFGEDAITSINLLSIKNQNLRNLAVEDTRIKESIKGCDFELWVGSHSDGWMKYAIQAKKLGRNKRYNSLAHKVRGKSQLSILESYSKANNAVPLYCFFNYIDTKKSYKTCFSQRDIKELGCSITKLKTVKKALKIRGARTFDWFHSNNRSIPWACLTRCSSFLESSQKPLIHYKTTPSSLESINDSIGFHSDLPNELKALLLNENALDSFKEAEYFSRNTDYRPNWVGVLDLGDML